MFDGLAQTVVLGVTHLYPLLTNVPWVAQVQHYQPSNFPLSFQTFICLVPSGVLYKQELLPTSSGQKLGSFSRFLLFLTLQSILTDPPYFLIPAATIAMSLQ